MVLVQNHRLIPSTIYLFYSKNIDKKIRSAVSRAVRYLAIHTPAEPSSQYLSSKPKIFIGYDHREHEAYKICKYSLTRLGYYDFEIVKLRSEDISEYNRNTGEPQSTDFTFTRFWLPYLCNYKGFSIFVYFPGGNFWFQRKKITVLGHWWGSGAFGGTFLGENLKIARRGLFDLAEPREVHTSAQHMHACICGSCLSRHHGYACMELRYRVQQS